MSRTLSRPVSGPSARSLGDSGILLAAIFAIASSALLVRWADAPAVALAFWRTLGGALVLGFLATVRPSAESRPAPSVVEAAGVSPRSRLSSSRRIRLTVAGLALAVHFATWLASLELTSVAASVTLVATAPLMIGLYFTVRGQPPTPATWVALLLALVGTAIIATGDVSGQPIVVDTVAGAEPDGGPLGLSRAIWGDILALIGAGAMAVYLIVGAELRRVLSTTAYTWRAYGVAAAGLAVGAGVARVPIVGFDVQTWGAIVAMTAGPQLIGHTGLNHLLRRLGSLTVSLALLTEPVAATALVWLALGEVPPATSLLGAPLVLGAIALHLLTAGRGPNLPDSG
ncbi:MAG: DMT family transporter [Acidimicrobiia bacterium]|nr:DMT family transporter [Acidimicrobiia bacterium]